MSSLFLHHLDISLLTGDQYIHPDLTPASGNFRYLSSSTLLVSSGPIKAIRLQRMSRLRRQVDREALESSYPVFQAGASPSQLTIRKDHTAGFEPALPNPCSSQAVLRRA